MSMNHSLCMICFEHVLKHSDKRSSAQAYQVLMKIRQKLDGVDGTHTALGVEGHVSHLIEVCRH